MTETRVIACSGTTTVIFIVCNFAGVIKGFVGEFSLCFGCVSGLRRIRSLSLLRLRKILISGDSSGVWLSVVIW